MARPSLNIQTSKVSLTEPHIQLLTSVVHVPAQTPQMDLLSPISHPTPSTPTNPTSMSAKPNMFTDSAPLSPPASPFPLSDAKVSHYTKPVKPPRFPRHPCPTSHYTLSLLSSEHEAQRLFGNSFTLRSPVTGELLGPFALLSYTDKWIPKYCRYIHSVVSTTVFTLRERELVVLAVASVSEAGYVIYAHRRIAVSVGLSEDAVEAALHGEAWMEMLDLSAREKNVYRLASEMAKNWGRVSDETWRAVVVPDRPKARGQEGWLEKEVEEDEIENAGWDDETDRSAIDNSKEGNTQVADGPAGAKMPDRLTREEIATLAQVLASTMFVSILVNCADVEVPQSEADIVQQP